MKGILELALESLEKYRGQLDQYGKYSSVEAIAALESAIKQRGEPVGIVNNACTGGIKWIRDDLPQKTLLYTSAPTIPEGCMWVVTKGGRSICQPPKAWNGKTGRMTIPEGWQLVPKIPNENMYDAGDTAFEDGYVVEMYKAILSAAPEYKA